MTFQDFLERQARQKSHTEWRARREEWIVAVGQLIEAIRTWLAQSDPEHILDVVPLAIERVEPNLGICTVPSLKIGLGAASVEVVPVGRNVVGLIGPHGAAGVRMEGRVDITDGIRRYILYRLVKDGQEAWYALDEKFRAAPLDQRRLDEIL